MRLPIRSLLALLGAIAFLLVTLPAHAAGTFKLKSTEVNEVSGAWHVYVTLELPKPPLTAHQSMKFVFTKTVVYERSLVDGRSEPVQNRQALQNQTPSIESLDVDFADPSGKIFKGTRFDFGLTRARGYEAGEYKVEVRTSDGVAIGAPQNLILKGDNPVVDRRAMTFTAKEKGVTKVEGYDGGAKGPTTDEPPPPSAANTDVKATGTATPFIPPEGYEKTPEEEIKTRPKGCGCDVPGVGSAGDLAWLAPGLTVGLAALRRRRRQAGSAAR